MKIRNSVREFMTTIPIRVDHKSTLRTAEELMQRYNFRHLPVMENDKLIGLISENDLRVAKASSPVDYDSKEVRILLRYEPYTVSPETEIKVVANEMAINKLGAAIVTEGGKVVGIFTTTDALRALIELDIRTIDS